MQCPGTEIGTNWGRGVTVTQKPINTKYQRLSLFDNFNVRILNTCLFFLDFSQNVTESFALDVPAHRQISIHYYWQK